MVYTENGSRVPARNRNEWIGEETKKPLPRRTTRFKIQKCEK